MSVRPAPARRADAGRTPCECRGRLAGAL